MEQIFELLKLHHIISIVLGFILSGFLAWLYEIKKAVNDLTTEKLTKGRISLGFDLDEQLVEKLKQNKNE